MGEGGRREIEGIIRLCDRRGVICRGHGVWSSWNLWVAGQRGGSACESQDVGGGRGEYEICSFEVLTHSTVYCLQSQVWSSYDWYLVYCYL